MVINLAKNTFESKISEFFNSKFISKSYQWKSSSFKLFELFKYLFTNLDSYIWDFRWIKFTVKNKIPYNAQTLNYVSNFVIFYDQRIFKTDGMNLNVICLFNFTYFIMCYSFKVKSSG